MNDRPAWFAPRRYGLGAGWPIAWQGWALTALLIVVVGFACGLFGGNDARALAILLPATTGYVIVAALTTRGGWRWRWGEDE